MVKKSIRNILIILGTVFFALIAFEVDTAKADYGDFYKKYKNEIDKFTVYEHHPLRKVIKVYDYDTNSFDCSWYDVACHIDGFLYGLMISITKGADDNIKDATIAPYDIIYNGSFRKYKEALQNLSVIMLAIFVMWNVCKIIAYKVADVDDDGASALNEKIVKMIVLSILLGLYTPLFTWILDVQQSAVSALSTGALDEERVVLYTFKYSAINGPLIALLIGVLKFAFMIAFTYRFIMFGILYITGVIAIPTGINDEYNYFSLWLRLLITNGVTLFIQALCYILGLEALFIEESLKIGICFFLFALSVPSLLGALGASTGTGRMMSSMGRGMTRGVGAFIRLRR